VLGSFSLCFFAAIAVAQAPGEDAPDDGEEPPSAEPPALEPPRVVSLPDVRLDPNDPMPADGVVRLELAIEADGAGTVETCDAGEAICARVADAISRAVFEPARRDGEAVPSRIAMRFRVLAPEPDREPEEPRPPEGSREPVIDRVEPELQFGATGTIERPPEGAVRLTLEETRDLPGTFGDPFRALEALPGVTPVLSGLPYFYVRGAPPSGTLYVYDDIQLPALFHLGLGPAVVHPAMVGPIRLYTGVPPARFGRFIGGVIEAEGPERLTDDRVHGDFEVRLLDVNAMIQVPIGDGELAVAGRYGYPGLLLSIFSPEVDLAYWDYQVRFSHPVGTHDEIQVVALGSYDTLTTVNDNDGPMMPGDEPDESSLGIHFHRLELRFVREKDSFEFGTALRFGWEESSLDDEIGIVATTLGSRLWMRFESDGLELRMGAELLGAAGDMTFTPEGGGAGSGDMAQDPARNSVFASVAGRSMAAAYAELRLDPIEEMTIDLGLRTDAWTTGATVEAAIDPRVRATFHVTDWLDLSLAGGVARQPAVFFIPLPGLTEVAIDRGLQTGAQIEAGVAVEPIENLEIEAQFFVHRYWDLLFPDLFIEDEVCAEIGAGCMEVQPDPRVDGLSYGAEVFVRRDPSERISGFLSYTLAWAELDAIPGIDYTPSYDVRHILNAAARWEIVDGFSIGLRLHLRSGKPLGAWYLTLEDGAPSLGRYEQRLPPFFRADASVAYAWETSWGNLRVTLEWLNLTWAEEPSALDCPEGLLGPPAQECPVEYLPAIVVPNLALRGAF
jgi:hypothetical protein